MLASVADVIHEATDGLEYGWLFCNESRIKITVRGSSSPTTKASSSDSFIYLLPRTAEHPGAPALATLERPFRAITYLFAAEPAPSTLSASRGQSMLQGAPALRTLWWKEVTGRRITIDHLYTIYMQYKLIHDRQPRSSGSQEGLRQGRGPGASAMNLQQGAELNWAPHALVCHPVSWVSGGSYWPSFLLENTATPWQSARALCWMRLTSWCFA